MLKGTDREKTRGCFESVGFCEGFQGTLFLEYSTAANKSSLHFFFCLPDYRLFRKKKYQRSMVQYQVHP